MEKKNYFKGSGGIVYRKSLHYECYTGYCNINIEKRLILYKTQEHNYHLNLFIINKSFNRIQVLNETLDTFNSETLGKQVLDEVYNILKKGVRYES